MPGTLASVASVEGPRGRSYSPAVTGPPDPEGRSVAVLGAAVALGAVDEVVPQNRVLERAIERAEYLGLRSKKSLGAIKRSVYFAGSMSLSEGLQFEHAEFLVRDQSKEAQRLMLEYVATTEATGELPLLNRKTYERALSTGSLGSHHNE
jgi:hypothetical protein